jgi:hypothetical protein
LIKNTPFFKPAELKAKKKKLRFKKKNPSKYNNGLVFLILIDLK